MALISDGFGTHGRSRMGTALCWPTKTTLRAAGVVGPEGVTVVQKTDESDLRYLVVIESGFEISGYQLPNWTR